MNKHRLSNVHPRFVLAGMIIVAGLMITNVVFAAVTNINFEAESGSLAGQAALMSDSTASSGSYLRFIDPLGPAPTGQWQNVTPPGVSFDHDYGIASLAQAKSNSSIIYVGSGNEGVWKTSDGGVTWRRPAGNIVDARFPCGGQPNVDGGRNWAMAVDNLDPNIIYTVTGYGCEQGIWRSTDGGETFRETVPETIYQQTTRDINVILVSPYDTNHVIATSHSNWANGKTGYLESRDRGITWTMHAITGMGGGLRVAAFMNNDNTMIVGSEGSGVFHTSDGGQTWTPVPSAGGVGHYSSTPFQASNGAFYLGYTEGIKKSTDNGRTWTKIKDRVCLYGYSAVIEVAGRLYTAAQNMGDNVSCPVYTEIASSSNDTVWSKLSQQILGHGPLNWAYDPNTNAIISGNGTEGMYRLQL